MLKKVERTFPLVMLRFPLFAKQAPLIRLGALLLPVNWGPLRSWEHRRYLSYGRLISSGLHDKHFPIRILLENVCYSLSVSDLL